LAKDWSSWENVLDCDVIFLLAVEYRAIDKDRADYGDQFKKIMGGFTSVNQHIAESRLLGLAQQQSAIRVKAVKAKPEPTTALAKLKRNAIILSSDLLTFLRQREDNAPQPNGAGGEGMITFRGVLATYDQDTMTIYSKMYEPEVSKFHNELVDRGIYDRRIDFPMGRGPQNAVELRVLADKIGEWGASN
jgi:hypothetical protein